MSLTDRMKRAVDSRTVKRRRLAVGLVLAALTTSAAAQDPSAEKDVFGEVIEVRVVNLEVVVTDQDGQRVPSLGPEAFRLVVDGDAVPIEFFTEIRSGVAMSSPGIAEGMELAPGTKPGQPLGTSYLVFLDEFFSVKRDRDDVLDEMIRQVGSLNPQDLVAVVAFDGREVETLSDWSRDFEKVRDVLERAKDRPTAGLQRIAEQSRFDPFDRIPQLSQTIRAGAEGVRLDFELTPEERFYGDILANQVRHAVEAAAATMNRFAAPPGRKVMLLAAGGWPFIPAEFVVAEAGRPIYDPRVAGGSELFFTLSDTANRLGYTIYPIDVPGLQGEGRLGSSIRGGDALFGNDREAALRRSGVGRGEARIREDEIHRSLEYLADETGGRALLNSGRLDAFETAREDTRSFYWIGFTPSWNRDDSHHDVRVELVDPSLSARTRSGFTDESSERERTMTVESALYFGNVPYTDELGLTFGRPQKAGRGTMAIPVRIEIPLDGLLFLPGSGGGHEARLELRIAVVDSSGNRAEVPVIPLFIEIPREPEAGDTYVREEELKMRRDWHRVIVAIYDQVGGTMLTGSAEVSP